MWIMDYTIEDYGKLDFITFNNGMIEIKATKEEQAQFYWMKITITDLYIVPKAKEYRLPVDIRHSAEYEQQVEQDQGFNSIGNEFEDKIMQS